MQLPNDIASCHKLIRQQAEHLAALVLRVNELEARLNQNSTNSSRPPSSDLVKPKRSPGLKRKKKSNGGQRGKVTSAVGRFRSSFQPRLTLGKAAHGRGVTNKGT